MDTHNLFTLRVTPQDISGTQVFFKGLPAYLHTLLDKLADKHYWNPKLPWIYCWETLNGRGETIPGHMHFIFFGENNKRNLREFVVRSLLKAGRPVRRSNYCVQEKLPPYDIYLVFRYCMKSGPFTHAHLSDIPFFLVNDQIIMAREQWRIACIYNKKKYEQSLIKQTLYDRMEKCLQEDHKKKKFCCLREIDVKCAQWYLKNTDGLNYNSIIASSAKFQVKNNFITLQEWMNSHQK